MIKSTLIITLLFFTLTSHASKCTPEVRKSNPPRLVNGEWVQPENPNQSELINADFAKLKLKQYDFVFSGVYTKEASFSEKKLSYIKTKKIWQGKVTEEVDVNMSKQPTDNQCNKLKYDQEYIFFAKLGNRSNPLILKEFRTASPELKALLGKPSKQWLRGRLIQSRK